MTPQVLRRLQSGIVGAVLAGYAAWRVKPDTSRATMAEFVVYLAYLAIVFTVAYIASYLSLLKLVGRSHKE